LLQGDEAGCIGKDSPILGSKAETRDRVVTVAALLVKALTPLDSGLTEQRSKSSEKGHESSER
jgi:hypothetical protein